MPMSLKKRLTIDEFLHRHAVNRHSQLRYQKRFADSFLPWLYPSVCLDSELSVPLAFNRFFSASKEGGATKIENLLAQLLF